MRIGQFACIANVSEDLALLDSWGLLKRKASLVGRGRPGAEEVDLSPSAFTLSRLNTTVREDEQTPPSQAGTLPHQAGSRSGRCMRSCSQGVTRIHDASAHRHERTPGQRHERAFGRELAATRSRQSIPRSRRHPIRHRGRWPRQATGDLRDHGPSVRCRLSRSDPRANGNPCRPPRAAVVRLHVEREPCDREGEEASRHPCQDDLETRMVRWRGLATARRQQWTSWRGYCRTLGSNVLSSGAQ